MRRGECHGRESGQQGRRQEEEHTRSGLELVPDDSGKRCEAGYSIEQLWAVSAVSAGERANPRIRFE